MSGTQVQATYRDDVNHVSYLRNLTTLLIESQKVGAPAQSLRTDLHARDEEQHRQLQRRRGRLAPVPAGLLQHVLPL